MEQRDVSKSKVCSFARPIISLVVYMDFSSVLHISALKLSTSLYVSSASFCIGFSLRSSWKMFVSKTAMETRLNCKLHSYLREDIRCGYMVIIARRYMHGWV